MASKIQHDHSLFAVQGGDTKPFDVGRDAIMLNAWLRRPGGSPADVARKSRSRELLGDVA